MSKYSDKYEFDLVLFLLGLLTILFVIVHFLPEPWVREADIEYYFTIQFFVGLAVILQSFLKLRNRRERKVSNENEP